MELSRIPEISPAHAAVLADAGVRTVAELAALSDLDALATRTRVHRATLESFQAAARAHVEALLEAAGVRGPEELARADLDALAQGTGLPRESLAAFQRVARARLGLPDAEPRPLPADRVVLSDGRASARVSLGGEVREGLAIVTLRMEEDDADVLERAPGDAVLLKERSVTATVRVDGALHRDLPIYKEIPVAQPGDAPEIRVRVAQIKDKPAPPAPEAAGQAKKGGFRLFRRGA